ncbi:LysR family transcriptional regulator [Crenobacter sp. SG2303]|uniref:LysR family transcriptional regulator n=1 Tax=Crenobacter oryzisoli TaxID=3056844 RepID=A0ABT7XN71_9NEIS|nr:LysR family transcriptional regulator [Crenobacter sp. SG2303]MDN0075221.1 LysR family transcriptional regulator [Crenobacter sp. SG2303]
MKLDQLDGIVAFVTVAQKRSFTVAAAQLEVKVPTVSQAVRALETRLGVRLFNRTTRSVGLTEAGERYFVRVAPRPSPTFPRPPAISKLGVLRFQQSPQPVAHTPNQLRSLVQ